jgi:hypothetical protein
MLRQRCTSARDGAVRSASRSDHFSVNARRPNRSGCSAVHERHYILRQITALESPRDSWLNVILAFHPSAKWLSVQGNCELVSRKILHPRPLFGAPACPQVMFTLLRWRVHSTRHLLASHFPHWHLVLWYSGNVEHTKPNTELTASIVLVPLIASELKGLILTRSIYFVRALYN